MAFEQYRDFIPDFARFQESLLHPIPAHLRINTLKGIPASVLHSMKQRGVKLEPSMEGSSILYQAPELTSPGNLLEYFLGHVHPQALTSCLASMALSPWKESFVLDLCASPGGKTSHLAAMMSNEGLIVANELHSSRRIALGHTMDRLGVTNTLVTAYPAQQFPMRERYDYILVDVPCTGEGTFRNLRIAQKHPIFSPGRKLRELQKKIILRAFDLLADEGVMLYSTCTYNPWENEGVVDHLLRHRDAVIHAVALDAPHEPGLTKWDGKSYDKQLERAARFYPHQIDSVGFFLARIGKSG